MDNDRVDLDGTSVRAVIECPRDGRFIMLGFPGLSISADGNAYLDPERLDLTITALSALDVRILIALTQHEELPLEAFGLLSAAAASENVLLRHLPVVDFGIPDEAFREEWRRLAPDVHSLLDRGSSIASACQHGAGRSGLVAALVLVERGMEPRAAIDLVRCHFAEAIENAAQEHWLQTVAQDFA